MDGSLGGRRYRALYGANRLNMRIPPEKCSVNKRSNPQKEVMFLWTFFERGEFLWKGISSPKMNLCDVFQLSRVAGTHILTIFSTSGISFDPLECFKLSCFSNIILVLRAQILLTKNYTKYFLPSLPFGSNIWKSMNDVWAKGIVFSQLLCKPVL